MTTTSSTEQRDVARTNPLEELDLAELRQRTSWKWRTYSDDVLPLWVAEMDVPLAPVIAEALTRAIEVGDTGYPTGTALGEAFIGFAARRWGWSGIEIGHTAVVPDVMAGIFATINVWARPGDALVINPPAYTPFYNYARYHGLDVVEAPLGDDLRLDLDTIDTAFEAATRDGRGATYLLCNPHNPTGVVHTRAELAAVAALARLHGVRVVSDEIHAPLVLPGRDFTPFVTVPGGETGFAVTSASKGWNLAGLKVGLVVSGPDAASDLAEIPAWLARGASHLGIIAHTVAYSAGEAWLDDLIAGLDDNRALLARLLHTHLPQVTWQPPESTFLAWLNCTQLGLDPSDAEKSKATFSDVTGPAKFFHDHAHVALSSGDTFGPGGRGYVRLNFAASQEVLTQAITQMGAAVDDQHRPTTTS